MLLDQSKYKAKTIHIFSINVEAEINATRTEQFQKRKKNAYLDSCLVIESDGSTETDSENSTGTTVGSEL